MTNKKLVVNVAVQNSIYHFDKEYAYLVPKSINSNDLTGYRVLVPFGKYNRRTQGYVVSSYYENEEKTRKYKSIISVLDDTQILNSEMIKIAYFIKNRCFCTLYDSIKTMLPSGINYNIKVIYMYNTSFDIENSDLNDIQKEILEFVCAKKEIEKDKITAQIDCENIDKILDELVSISALLKDYKAQRKVSDMSIKMVRLINDKSDLKLTQKQKDVLETLEKYGEISLKELCYYSGVTKAVCDNLYKKGVIEYFESSVMRSVQRVIPKVHSNKINLTNEQQNAYNDLLDLYRSEKPSVSLLYGITGSGKTSVFMSLIDKVHNDGKDVILMVPEIALTPQMINLFTARFGTSVAVFHSALSLGQRLDEWKRVKSGVAKIVVGTRSAVFAPFNNLGLIIMDEEQEYTYKSDSTPRYHAREIAKLRCVNNNCLLLLSSATPSIESYYNAQIGKYSLSVLKNRYGNAQLPNVIMADMNIEIEQGNTTGYSSVLLQAIEDNLSDKKQSIILMNRRGHNTFVTCRKCKESITCPNCSISLTYHSSNNRLMCHYCGYSQSVITQCDKCGSSKLNFGGMGTQKAEIALADMFPQAKILRIDADVTMTKNSHEKLLTQFENGDYDIMIGTQMVAKGLNFPNVTLVGVLSADQMLYADDFRSYERTFSLLTQVVGRSGRGKHKGRAIIQTFSPENPIIYLSAEQNYEAFYNSDIILRKTMLYPPFADMCMIGFVGADDRKVMEVSKEFAKQLTQIVENEHSKLPLRILGPTHAVVKKVSNKYRYKLILKFKNSKTFRKIISELLIKFGKDKEYKDVLIYVDVNPDTIL